VVFLLVGQADSVPHQNGKRANLIFVFFLSSIFDRFLFETITASD
jgi:hypothetical protein